MKHADFGYAASIMAALPPEAKFRLRKLAAQEGLTVEDVVVSFLRRGANTPMQWGINNLAHIVATSGC